MRLAVALLALAGLARTAAPAEPVVFDTDFALPPADDGMALALALNSPELEVLGITTVAGNKSLEQGTADVLRMLEVAGRTEIPVYRGADMPLLHEKSAYAATVHGKWWSDDPASAPWGGFARKPPERESAVEFLLRTVLARPGQVTLLAIGPLTNVAMALRLEPRFAASVKQIVIMGGALATLPDGAGNITPNAEFNFWVDPEAAKAVLRSAIPKIVLSPLNVSRKTGLTRAGYEKMVAVDTPLTRLFRETMGPEYAQNPGLVRLMYDQVAVASLIDSTLVQSADLYVDVDAQRGIDYGTSIGGTELWPGAEGARRMQVQFGLDWERFFGLFVERVTRPTGSRR